MTDGNNNKTSQNDDQVKRAGQALLDWYDRHRRVLPWRALPGQTPDPYHVWLSEVMLQQTVVKAAIPYFLYFVENWPTVHDLARAPQEDVMTAWAGLGYYARARNLHKCAKIVSADYGGIFPDTQAMLKQLPGIGDYTAAAITAIAFNKPATVVDGNVERVMARIYAVTEPLPDSKKALHAHASEFAGAFRHRPGDLAQAMMDLGAGICIPKAPRCVLCPVKTFCRACEKGGAENLPVKKARKVKPEKHGYIYCVKDKEGNILIHKRPESGLLGGMTGFPTSAWVEKTQPCEHPAFIKDVSRHYATTVKIMENMVLYHSFTHFNLKLTGCILDVGDTDKIIESTGEMHWIPLKKLEKGIFPTVFRKFYQLIQ